MYGVNTSASSGVLQYDVDHAQRDFKVKKSACSNGWVFGSKNRGETHRCYSANKRHFHGRGVAAYELRAYLGA